MFVEYQKIHESSFDKFIIGNFVDLRDLQKDDSDTKYLQIIGVSEYRFTLFISKYY